MKVTRKCNVCHDDIDINEDNYLKENKKYSHTQCFINKHRNKRKPLPESEILNKVNEIKSQMELESKETASKDIFIKYIQATYSISYMPSYTFIKLSEIVNGNYKSLKESISYEDLLYMFQTKQDFLNKNADKKVKQGSIFKDGLARFNYDLAVIISKYDNYKQWKEKQKLLEIQTEQRNENENNKIDFNYINSINQNTNNTNNDEVNIYDILDEI